MEPGSTTVERVQWLNEVLGNRPGWHQVVAEEHDSHWVFHDSFGGVPMNAIEDVTPEPLSAQFSLDEHDTPAAVLVTGIGLEDACPDHGRPVATLNFDELDQLPAILLLFEQAARGADALDWVRCRVFGPCGQSS